MKRLVLCEGRRDVWFVEAFYAQLQPDTRVDTFYGEDVAYERLKKKEAQRIRSFEERRNPYDVLAKSENGKSDLKRVFTKLCRQLAAWEVRVAVVVDLDGGSLERLVGDLDQRVRDNFSGQQFGVRLAETHGESDAQVAGTVGLRSERSDGRLDTFDVVAFRHDLETAAGIGGSEDDGGEREKLRRFAADE